MEGRYRRMSQRGRLDFVQRIVAMDEKSGKVELELMPDPRRYEWREIQGKRLLYDKLDKAYFPEDLLDRLAEGLRGIPIYFEPPLVQDAAAYAQSRKSTIQKLLDGEELPLSFADKSEEFLRQLPRDVLGFVILSVDIVKSTRLAAEMEPSAYARVVTATLHELGEVVPKFRGFVLKYTGDGLIAYFPEPSFITKNDLALDCGLTMRRLVDDIINPELVARQLPRLELRFGLDAGEAFVKAVGSAETKRHMDIIGFLINLATKIQGLAPPGSIYLGETVYRNLHTNWRLACQPVVVPLDWEYQNLEGSSYGIFSFVGF